MAGETEKESGRLLVTTPLCDRLGIRVPIVQAPIGPATTSELVAAVAHAGALGMLAVTWLEPRVVAERIRQVEQLTTGRFGVNVSLAFDVDAQLDTSLELGVKIISTFWGDPTIVHERIRAAGALHLHTVRSPREARAAVDVGVDVVVAQGWEAGGHVWGEVATMALVPAVVDEVMPVPVIAAGGIADGRGLAAALMLGAQAVWLGTRFVAAIEAGTHTDYRGRIVEASVADTVYTTCFDGGWPNAPHRVLSNNTFRQWEAAGRPAAPDRPGEGTIVASDANNRMFHRYDDMMPLPDVEGDIPEMALYAGQSTGLIREVLPAATIITTIAAEAHQALRTWQTTLA